MAKLKRPVKFVSVIKAGRSHYVYYRRGDFSRRILCDQNDIDRIEREAAQISQELEGGPKPVAYAPETLGWLIDEYKASHWWGALKPATQSCYERTFKVLTAGEPSVAAMPVKWFDRPKILRLRDDAWHPRYKRWLANMTVTVLGLLLKYAYDRGYVKANPLAESVRKIRKPKTGLQPNRPWKPNELRVVLEEAAQPVRLVLTLIACTGLRKSDAFKVTTGDVAGGTIEVVTNKREMPVALPIHWLLSQAIAERQGPDLGPLCIGRRGRPYTPDGFDTQWHKLKSRLEKEGKIGPGLTLHGLRHTLGTKLKEAGLSDGDIADVLGQATVTMARLYSKNAALPEDVQDRIRRLEIGGPRSQKVL